MNVLYKRKIMKEELKISYVYHMYCDIFINYDLKVETYKREENRL